MCFICVLDDRYSERIVNASFVVACCVVADFRGRRNYSTCGGIAQHDPSELCCGGCRVPSSAQGVSVNPCAALLDARRLETKRGSSPTKISFGCCVPVTVEERTGVIFYTEDVVVLQAYDRAIRRAVARVNEAQGDPKS